MQRAGLDKGSDRAPGAGAPRAPRGRWFPWELLGLVALVAAGYGQTLGFGLVLEDHFVFVENRLLQHWGRWWEVFTAPLPTFLGEMSGAERTYRPFMVLAGAADRAIWGMHPGAFHLSSVLTHLAVVLLLWRLARQMTGNAWTAFAAGALLAVHPSAVEAVTGVWARMDLFVGLGMVATLLLVHGCAGPAGTPRLVGALFCFAFALGSKETALAIPVIVTWVAWVYPAWFGGPDAGPGRAGLAARVAPFWIVLVPYALFRRAVIGNLAPIPLHLTDIPTQLLRVLVAVASYAEMTLIPRPVSVSALLSRVAPPAGPADGRVLLGVALIGLLVGGLLWLRRHHWPSAVALGWYAAALVPTSNLVPIHWEHAVYVAERSLYPALGGWCLFLAVGGHALWSRARRGLAPSPRFLGAAGAAAVGVLLVVTASRAGAWRDDLTLWRTASISDPHSVVARYNVARSLARAGDRDGAQAAIQETVTLFPGDPHVLALAAWIAELRGEGGRALDLYKRASALGPLESQALRQAAMLAARSQEWDQAGRWFGMAAARFPQKAWPEVGLGWYYKRELRPDLAQAHFDRAARLEPHAPERPWFLGQLLSAEGRLHEAVQVYQAALRLDPSFVPARRELAFLAEREGRTAEAMADWRHIAQALPAGDQLDEALAHLRRLEASGGRAPGGRE